MLNDTKEVSGRQHAQWYSNLTARMCFCWSNWRFWFVRHCTTLQTVSRSRQVYPHIYPNWQLDEAEESTYRSWIYSYETSRSELSCVTAVACRTLTNLPQKVCELYILAISPGRHAEEVLPDFDSPTYLYPNAGKRRLSAVFNVPTLTENWSTWDQMHSFGLEKSMSLHWLSISQLIRQKMNLSYIHFLEQCSWRRLSSK